MSGWHKGDSGKSVLFVFTDLDGNPLDLTDCDVVEVEVQAPRRPWVTLEMADIIIDDPTTGAVAYPIPEGDTDFFWTAGIYSYRGYHESPTLGWLHTDIATDVVEP